jgi:hypothetical protein
VPSIVTSPSFAVTPNGVALQGLVLGERVVDVGGELGVGSIEHPQQVAAGDDADEPSGPVDDRQQLPAVGQHPPRHVAHRVVQVSCLRRCSHDPARSVPSAATPTVRGLGDEVGLADHAEQVPGVVHDRERADAVAQHEVDDLLERCGGRHGDRRSGHDVSDPDGEHLDLLWGLRQDLSHIHCQVSVDGEAAIRAEGP